jgi:Tol biopolymer transport system component
MRHAWILAASLGLLAGCDSGQVAAPVSQGVQWTRITNSSDLPQPYFPDWRGNQILLSYQTSGGYRRLAVMNADGSNVTFLSAGDTTRDSPGRWVDDTKIVFASNRATQGSTHFDLWTRDIVTDEIRQLTSFPESEFDPAPRPGTTGLAFTDGSEFAGRIALIPDYTVATPELILLTPSTLKAGQVDWDPTGQRICFSADSTGGSRHVWMITLAPGDSTPVQLTFGPYVDSCPRFSPDGTRILFASDKRTGRPAVWTIPLQGEVAGLRVVAFDDIGAVTDTPCWSPDAMRVIVSSKGRGFGRCLWVLSNLP